VITKEIIFEVTRTYTILIIYVSVVRWDQKNLKPRHERHNLDRRNLATMLLHEEEHKQKIMKMKQ
jgi:hypothetical protein